MNRASRGGRVLVAVGIALTAVAAKPPAASEGELERLRGAIRDTRERVGAHEREERSLLEQLEEVDRNLERLSAEVTRTRAEARAARQTLDEARSQHANADQRLAATRRAMAVRAVALYKAGELGPVQVLFTSTSAKELMTRVSMLESLVEYDAGLVRRFQAETSELTEARAAARQAAARSEQTARTAAERGAARSRERAAQRRLLASVRDDRARERALLLELERAARALEETLVALGDRAASASGDSVGGGFEALRGALRAPVEADISRSFGREFDDEYRTAIDRKGVEFEARQGDPVQCVAFGEVRYAGWFRGYGKIVIIDHGDGYFTVSGHLEEISVSAGETLAAGDVVGTVGATGSLSGPSLYFEIRQGSEPLDPADWLR